MTNNPFADDWRDCLREHYLYVIRTNDHVTKPSLMHVMHEVGFSDVELAELEVRATMRAEDAPDDFVPNLDILKTNEVRQTAEPKVFAGAAPEVAPAAAPLPSESDTPPIEQPPTPLFEAESSEEDSESPETADDDDAPQQLSLF